MRARINSGDTCRNRCMVERYHAIQDRVNFIDHSKAVWLTSNSGEGWTDADSSLTAGGWERWVARHWQPRFIPRRHAAREHAHGLKAFPSQDLCRSDRAAFLVSDSDDGVRTVSCQVVKLGVEFRQRAMNRPGNMSSLANEFVWVPNIKHKR
jgi:hypothetical protein